MGTQWQASVGVVPLALLQAKETTELHKVRMVSEFLPVSMARDSLALMMS